MPAKYLDDTVAEMSKQHLPSPSRPILIIACHFPPENIIGALRPARFFRHLPEFGYRPMVLTASAQSEPHADIHTAPDQPHPWAERVLSRVLPGDDRLFWAETAFRAGAELLRRQPCDAILSTSPPYSVHQAAARLAAEFGIPWIADVRDPLTGNAARASWGPGAWLDRREERRILGASHVILNTEAAWEHWRRRYPTQAGKLSYLYNGFDLDDMPGTAGPVADAGRHVMLHAGSLYNLEYVRLLLGALRGLIEAGHLDPAKFQLRFMGYVPSDFENMTDFRYLAQRGAACLRGHLPRAEARQEMRSASSLLMLDYYRPAGGSLQLPAKIFDYLPIGRPVLAFTTPRAPLHDVLEASRIPSVSLFRGDDPQILRDKILGFLAIGAGPHSLSTHYRTVFDGRTQTGELAARLNQVLAVPALVRRLPPAAPKLDYARASAAR